MSNRKCLGIIGIATLVAGFLGATSANAEFQNCAGDAVISYFDFPYDGSQTEMRYDDGTTEIYRTPSATFDPLIATENEIFFFGLPPRPSAGDDVSAWLHELNSIHPPTNVCRSSLAGEGFEAQFSTNWAGYDVEDSAGTYVAVQGNFHLSPITPSYSSLCAGNTYASWVGLGGVNTGKLVQAGVLYSGQSSNPQAFYEFLRPGGGIEAKPLSQVIVSPNDYLHVYVAFSTSLQQVNFYVYDGTSGTSQSLIQHLDPNSYFDGSTAEWIDERLAIGSSISPLSNFGNNDWSNVKVQRIDGVWYSLNSQTRHRFQMRGSYGGTILADPGTGPTSSTSFTDFFYGCEG